MQLLGALYRSAVEGATAAGVLVSQPDFKLMKGTFCPVRQ